MSMLLNESLFAFEPSSKIAIAISETYKKKAFNSISTITNAVHKVTGMPIHDVIDEIFNKLQSYPVSSMFYNYNTKLVHSLTELRNINQVMEILEKLSIHDINDLISYYPKISNL